MATFEERREGGELVLRVGEARRIEHVIASSDGTEFEVETASISIYGPDDEPVVEGEDAEATEDAASEQRVWYVWDTAEAEPGDYRYVLAFGIGEEVRVAQGDMVLLPEVTAFDRWVQRVRDWLMETAGEGAALLSWRQARDAALGAVRTFEQYHPQRLVVDVALKAGETAYALPDDWEQGFSAIAYIEYPADSSPPRYLQVWEYSLDEANGTWHLTRRVPATDEAADLCYTAPHVLTHDDETVPQRYFHSVTQYAAGTALLQLANMAAHTAEPAIGAAVAGYRDKQTQYRQQGMELQRLATSFWTTQASLSVGTLAL